MKPLDCVIKRNKKETRRRGGHPAAPSRPQISILSAFYFLKVSRNLLGKYAKQYILGVVDFTIQ